MCKNGLNVYKYLNTLHDLLGIPHMTPAPSRNISPSSRTFRQFLDDMEKLIPLDKLKALFKQEETTSTVWKSFVDRISSKEFRVSYYLYSPPTEITY
ncbi:hypothetical protein PR048_019717 [Dryococelus australis]|uniref:Uncharacterized protein n=1 Tax=Dryococelus australis TaxID=614101 RepID=A0ABQ9H4I8_9NEOP|nr:hypothetical protein PR048_019717 [Dryococelus australis]